MKKLPKFSHPRKVICLIYNNYYNVTVYVNTHIGREDLLPLFVFFAITGVPKCSGFVNGSWSSVWIRNKQITFKSHFSLHEYPLFNSKSPRHLTSLSAKCLSPFKQSEVRLNVLSSPSSKTVINEKEKIYVHK